MYCVHYIPVLSVSLLFVVRALSSLAFFLMARFGLSSWFDKLVQVKGVVCLFLDGDSAKSKAYAKEWNKLAPRLEKLGIYLFGITNGNYKRMTGLTRN